jgi:nucleoside-diphosphate-sugar epimerase
LKVLLTGATGFIGSHVARLLVRNGCAVYAVIRPGSDTWRIADVMPSLRAVNCDLLSASDVDANLRTIRPDVCVHLAWGGMPGKAATGLENLDSLGASLNLARSLADLGCQKILAAGTCFEYDTDQGRLSETSPTRPRGLYGASKLALYNVLGQMAGDFNMRCAWLRFFYLYGPFEDERRLVPSVILSLLSNRKAKVTPGEQVRDYLHVEDAAAAVWDVLDSDLAGAINVGSGAPVTVREMVSTLGALLGRTELIALGGLPYRDGDPMCVYSDSGRLTEGTAWKPRFDLERGLRQTVEWWQGRVSRGG